MPAVPPPAFVSYPATTVHRWGVLAPRRRFQTVAAPANPPPAAGTILSVAIGADGWYADVTIAGLDTGGTYAFGLGANNDPAQGNPAVVFTVTSLGFDNTGAPTTVTRTVYGTHAVRQPYPNATLNQETVASGAVTIRIALSNYIYAKDNAGGGNAGVTPTVTIASGVYTQSGTPSIATSMVVTNNSTHAYPKVVGNWSWPGYDKLGASFTLRAVAYHRSANSGNPVQCVKFTATDQHANTNTATVTAPTVDSTIGDNTPVVEYVATMDGSGFAQGDVVNLNFVAYPAVGDTAACLDTAAGTAQPTPLYGPIAAVCDKNGTYATSVAVVDPVTGNDTTGTVTAAFNVNNPPAAYLTMAAAFNALRSYNNTNYGRNNCGGSIMYLKDGTHPWVNGSVTLGTNPDTWLTIAKFPTSTRSNVIIGTFATGHSLGLKVKLQDVLITGQSSSGNISAGAGSWLWTDRCEFNAPVANQPTVYINTVWYATRCLVTSLAQGFHPFSVVNTSPALVRGNTVIATGTGPIPYTMIGNSLPASSPMVDSYTGQTIPTPVNTIVAYNRISGPIGSAAPVALRMTTTTETHGLAFIQNLIEITASSVQAAFQISADSSTGTPVNNVMVWNNVVAGQRTNIAYNENDATGLAVRLGWSVKNNIFDDANIKSDTFAGSGFNASGTKVGNWSLLYGCGCSGNLYAEISGISTASGNFLWEMPGLRSYQPSTAGQPPAGAANALGFIKYVNRQSYNGTTTGAGGGDYHVLTSSPASSLQFDFLLPYDLSGAPRLPNDAAGAFSLVAVPAPSVSRASFGPRSVAILARRGRFHTVPSARLAFPSQIARAGTQRVLVTCKGRFAPLATTSAQPVWPPAQVLRASLRVAPTRRGRFQAPPSRSGSIASPPFPPVVRAPKRHALLSRRGRWIQGVVPPQVFYPEPVASGPGVTTPLLLATTIPGR